ncbi:hypothetical protein ACIPM0_15925 [Pseudomonas sichuanensis]|uniref:hypothetical protein n=1 Tax=Pseudomonas sichuanensis TaxID=2213015 RepID=UPI00381AB5B9
MRAKTDKAEQPHVAVDAPNSFAFHYFDSKGAPLQKTVSISPRLQNWVVFQCILRVLRAFPKHNKKRAIKIVNEAAAFLRFIDFSYTAPQSIPASILELYSQHLNRVEGLELSSIRTKMTHLRLILESAISSSWFDELTIDERSFVLSTYAKRPSIPKNVMTDGKFPALSELLASSQYDDLMLLDSLVHFCLGFLSETQRLREKLLADKFVQEALSFCYESEEALEERTDFYSNMRLYDAVFDCIISSKDEAFAERLLYSNPRFEQSFYASASPYSLSELYIKLKACVRESGSLGRKNVKIGHSNGKAEEFITFDRFDVRSLLSTCKTEEICLRWLLAADRIQQSGQEGLLLNDFDLTGTQLTINYTKNRSETPDRMSATYKKKTQHYKIYQYHLELRRKFSSLLKYDELNPEHFFQYESPFSRKQRTASRTYGPIFFSCQPGTHAYRVIAEKYPGAKLFQRFYSELGTQNDTDKSKDYGIAQTRGVTANIIAQSRAIIDPVKPSNSRGYDRYARAKVEAAATAHSEQVAQAAYRIPSRTSHRLNRRSDFVSAAGSLQEADARKLSIYMSKTSVMSLEEVNNLLGWTVSYYTSADLLNFNDLVARAEAKGYSCTPFGSFTSNYDQERVIIKIPETVALILSYIDGCKIELASSSTKERDHAMILNIAYARLVLEEFDQRTLSDGRKLHEESTIPPAVI